jgi:DNA processing protein
LNEDIKYRVAFSRVPGIGRVRLGQLEGHFGGLEAAWQAPAEALAEAGLDGATQRAITRCRDEISPDAEMERLEHLGIRVLTPDDDAYPARLKEIYDCPPLLYIKGELRPEDDWCLAVVGTRRATAYGRQVTEEIVTDLARSRITIVSGLARGIDTVAHKSALAAGGRTIAVLGCGLDICYPAENEKLAREIVERGAILSEQPLGMRPRPENFPRRNRIMSGLSRGVLVTEAPEGSGALFTANFAVEQNRDVFAVPGSILAPGSRMTNKLIQEGAKLVRGYTDILEELNLTAVAHQLEVREILPPSETEALLIEQLGAEPVHIDEVCRTSGLPAATVSGTLAMMELKGMVRQVEAMRYVLVREMRPEYRVRVD